MGKVCAFFGHRDAYTASDSLIESNVRQLIDRGVSSFWCGGYGKFDAKCAHVVHGLKRDYPEMELVFILPYLTGSRFYEPDFYDAVLFPEGLEAVPPRFAIARRNQWMVKNSDIIIAWVDHTWGGAYNTCRIAVKQGKEVINLAGMAIER